MAFNEIRPFRYWCNKVLPMVYDDSLSYYELLCKVVKHMNDIGSNVNSLGENVQFVYEEFNKFIKDFDGAVDEVVEESLDRFVREGMVVASVNGQRGYVVLESLPNPNPITFSGAVSGSYDGSAPLEIIIPEGGGTGNVESVNGKEGVVVLDAEDVGAVKSAGWSGEDAGKVLGVDGEGNVVAVNGGTGAVRSVNGYTGDVVIDATDIGAVPGEGWSSADNGKFLKIDSNGDVVAVAGSGEAVVVGVSSVNGQTGDVTIDELPSPGTLTFSGGASGSYDGSEDVTVVIPEPQEIPEALPNPNALVFTGAVSGRYDGSQEVTVNIPEGSDNQALTFSGAVKATYDGSEAVNVAIPERSPTPSALSFAGTGLSFDGSEPVSVSIPTKLPNPQALTFTGAVSAVYDGTQAISVNIPSGGGGGISGLTLSSPTSMSLVENEGATTKRISLGVKPKNGDFIVFEFVPYNAGDGGYRQIAIAGYKSGSAATVLQMAVLGEYGASHAVSRSVELSYLEEDGAGGYRCELTVGHGYRASIGQSGTTSAYTGAIGITRIWVLSMTI